MKRWLIVPELAGWYAFYGFARLSRRLGRFGKTPRAVGVWGFALFLPLFIVIGLPLGLLGTGLAHPLLRRWRERYAARLAAPTGEPRPSEPA